MRTAPIESSQWIDVVIKGAAQLHLDITPYQATQFARHARMVIAWNQKFNLTAITEPVEMAVKHFLDSVAPFAHIPPEGRILDIGTGGGFPGIPLKILRPAQPMTLIDGTRKKINFLKQVIRTLGLEKIEALHLRAEAMATMASHIGRYDVIVSRAVSDVKEVVRFADPLLGDGGRVLVYKGPGEKTAKMLELEPGGSHRNGPFVYNVSTFSYTLPFSGDHRKIISLQRSAV